MRGDARRLTRLRRDVRRASARVVGCRPREVVLRYERRSAWCTIATAGLWWGARGSLACDGVGVEGALRSLLVERRRQLRLRRRR